MNTSRNMLTLTLINDRYAFQFDTGVVAWTLQKKHAHRNLERTVLHLERYNSSLTPEHNRTRQYPAELLLLLLFSTRLKLLLDEGLYVKKRLEGDTRSKRAEHIPRQLGRLTKMHLRDRGARSRRRNARRGGVGARTVRGAEATVAVGRRVGAVASAVGREGRRRHRRHHRRRHHRGLHHRGRHHRLLHDRHRVRHGDVAVHGHLTDDRARNRGPPHPRAAP